MSTRQITVGITPVLLANGNDRRSSIVVTVLPSSIASGNTGNVFVAKGAAPSAAVGSPTQGDALSQGSQWSEVGQFVGDPSVFTGPVWAVADTAGQIVGVDVAYSQA